MAHVQRRRVPCKFEICCRTFPQHKGCVRKTFYFHSAALQRAMCRLCPKSKIGKTCTTKRHLQNMPRMPCPVACDASILRCLVQNLTTLLFAGRTLTTEEPISYPHLPIPTSVRPGPAFLEANLQRSVRYTQHAKPRSTRITGGPTSSPNSSMPVT